MSTTGEIDDTIQGGEDDRTLGTLLLMKGPGVAFVVSLKFICDRRFDYSFIKGTDEVLWYACVCGVRKDVLDNGSLPLFVTHVLAVPLDPRSSSHEAKAHAKQANNLRIERVYTRTHVGHAAAVIRGDHRPALGKPSREDEGRVGRCDGAFANGGSQIRRRRPAHDRGVAGASPTEGVRPDSDLVI